MSSVIPIGRYVAMLVRRKSVAPNSGGGVEYTFRVGHGEYEGSLVSMRVWAAGRIARADKLPSRCTVEIAVRHRMTPSGRRYAVVNDFRKFKARTAGDVVRGESESTPELTRAEKTTKAGELRPCPLIAESELENLLYDEEGATAFGIPYLRDDVMTEVQAAAQDRFEEPLHAIDSPPDVCGADDDADEHVWVVTRLGSNTPAPARLDDTCRLPLALAYDAASEASHCSLFQYTDDLPSYMAAHRQSVRGYAGVAWSSWLPLRLTSEVGLGQIHERARLIARACVSLGVPREQVIVINSWNCDLTLLIPSGAANAVAQVGFERVAGYFAQILADLACMGSFGLPMTPTPGNAVLPKNPNAHANIDRQLYGPVAVHPILNAPDEWGSLYSVPLSYQELMTLEVRDLETLAKAPRPIPRPPWRANCVDELESLWDYAVEAEQGRAKRYAHLLSPEPFVYADTFDWMLHGCDSESAPKRLYRAAVNLLRVGCSPGAVVELLHPAAYLSGCSREDVRWGVRKAAESLVSEGLYLHDDQW
jgi:hypothetical protein